VLLKRPLGAAMTASRNRRTYIAVALLFAALTVLVTYPQVRGFGTAVPYHTDPYFSMWRLGWVAHAIATTPGAVFDANIFYPERHTLAYSDAMLLPGIVAAPLFWTGISPIRIYNGLLFAAFALSGFTMFVLARHLTGNVAAAVVAGTIYAFAPYRFTHYMHLELQLVFWIPLALLMIHRILSNARIRDGVILGMLVGCQILSSIYSGVFLLAYCVVLGPCLLLTTGKRSVRSLALPVITAAVIATVLACAYGPAYLEAARTVGTRTAGEVQRYSASLRNYFSAPKMNRLYGWTAVTDQLSADEMNLFAGVTAMVLALLGIVAARQRVRLAYVAGLVFAIAMTSGVNGFVYPWLFEHVLPFSALRSPARFDVLITLSLAVLSAYGADVLLCRIGKAHLRQMAATGIIALLIVEYASAPQVSAAPQPSRIDAYLARKPPAVIVELPVVSARGIWLSLDFLYMYQGLSHLQRMLNGYSGFAPPSFYQMRQVMTTFPDDASMDFLRNRHVDYVIVRVGLYDPAEATALLDQIRKRPDLSLVAMWTSGPAGSEAIYAMGK